MGQYIGCGIATKLTVRKKSDRTWNELPREELLNILSKQLDLSIFSVAEDDEYLYLTVKEELLENNILSFINEQLLKINSKYYKDDLDKLKKLKGKKYQDLLEEAEDGSISSFDLMEGNKYSNNVSYLTNGDHECYADTIVYFCEGKVLMECYYHLFKYMRKLIIEGSKNPIKNAVMVALI